MEQALTYGKMEGSTMDSGKTTIWRDMVYTCGKTEEDTKANTIMIRNVDSVSTIGQMAESTKDGGSRASNMG